MLKAIPAWSLLTDEEKTSVPSVDRAIAMLVSEHNVVPGASFSNTLSQKITKTRSYIADTWGSPAQLSDAQKKVLIAWHNVKQFQSIAYLVRIAQLDQDVYDKVLHLIELDKTFMLLDHLFKGRPFLFYQFLCFSSR